jgi:Na+/H+ antiporter NhaC
MQMKARTTDQAVIRLQIYWILSIIFSLITTSCTSAESDDLIDRSFITKKTMCTALLVWIGAGSFGAR